MIEFQYCPNNGWLVKLAEGWCFPDEFVPDFMFGHHGRYSIMLVRGEFA